MKYYIFLLIILFAGCKSSTNNKDLYKNTRFFDDAEIFFSKYKYEVTGYRSAGNFIIFQLEIPKENLSIETITALNAKILDRGWKYNYDKKGYYWSYCKLGSYDSLGIYYPTQESFSLRNGDYLRNELDPNSIHVWFRKDSSKADYKEYAECE